MAKAKKYYVVWKGHTPGVYDSWAKCLVQTKAYPDARYKSFKTKEEAEDAFHDDYLDHYEKKKKKPLPGLLPEEIEAEINWNSIAVDAACSGNPGKMEYQGVETKSGFQLFHVSFPMGTNNIGEFLALVHALAMFGKEGKDTPIYSDSRIAIAWVKAGKCRSKLKRSRSTKTLYEVIGRAEKWLATHQYKNEILKWDTERWGEIPADFGRK